MGRVMMRTWFIEGECAMPAQLTEAQDRAIAADYAAGMRRDDICAKHGVSRSAVTAAVRRQGGSLRPSGAPQRVSDATRAAIVADRRSGTLPDALAAKYGVGCDVVTRLVDKAMLGGRERRRVEERDPAALWLRHEADRKRVPAGWSSGDAEG